MAAAARSHAAATPEADADVYATCNEATMDCAMLRVEWSVPPIAEREESSGRFVTLLYGNTERGDVAVETFGLRVTFTARAAPTRVLQRVVLSPVACAVSGRCTPVFTWYTRDDVHAAHSTDGSANVTLPPRETPHTLYLRAVTREPSKRGNKPTFTLALQARFEMTSSPGGRAVNEVVDMQLSDPVQPDQPLVFKTVADPQPATRTSVPAMFFSHYKLVRGRVGWEYVPLMEERRVFGRGNGNNAANELAMLAARHEACVEYVGASSHTALHKIAMRCLGMGEPASAAKARTRSTARRRGGEAAASSAAEAHDADGEKDEDKEADYKEEGDLVGPIPVRVSNSLESISGSSTPAVASIRTASSTGAAALPVSSLLISSNSLDMTLPRMNSDGPSPNFGACLTLGAAAGTPPHIPAPVLPDASEEIAKRLREMEIGKRLDLAAAAQE